MVIKKLTPCPDCGMQPSVTLRSRGINWGSAQIRCSNGCPTRKAGFSFPPDGERAARGELEKRWENLVAGESDGDGRKE